MDRIMIEYHPVKNEIYFSHENNGYFVRYADGDLKKLGKYLPKREKEKNNFLLQNQGTRFFDDLCESIPNIETHPIVFKGTYNDFVDFRKMVENYNEQKRAEILKIDSHIELNDVEMMYNAVVDFTKKVLLIFDQHIEIPEIKAVYEKHKDDYFQKKEELDKNSVNLCFVGTYSSGKSTLINALIGESVLPTSIESKTAKMFKIQYSDETHVKIQVQTDDSINEVAIKWNGTHFYCDAKSDDGITGDLNKKLKELPQSIKDNPNPTQVEQLEAALTIINDLPSEKTNETESFITGMIEVFYPLAFGKNIHFTIYDTPGTDSNTETHLKVLKEALRKQTNSILIVVYAPNKMEGTGNSILFELMNESQSKSSNESNVTIDMARSIHIINSADTVVDAEEDIPKLTSAKIKTSLQNDATEFEYCLEDQRVFVISAIAGYLAKKKIANKLNKKESKKYGRFTFVGEEQYYKYNHLGSADNETQESIATADKKISTSPDPSEKVFIGSGVDSVEQEIQNYADKYALCVKTKALYQSISHLIEEVYASYFHLTSEKEEDLQSKIAEIERLKNSMRTIITSCYEEYKPNLTTEALADDRYVKNLHTTINNYHEQAKKEATKMRLLATDTAVFSQKNKAIIKNINQFMAQIHDCYIRERAKILKTLVEDYKDRIRQALTDCKEISEEWIETILDTHTNIQPSNVYAKSIDDFVADQKLFWFLYKIDKSRYKEDIATQFAKKTAKLFETYLAELNKNLNSSIKDLNVQILANIEKLSKTLEDLCTKRDELQIELDNLKLVLDLVRENETALEANIWAAKESEV